MNIKSKQVLPYVAAAVAASCGAASAATLTVTANRIGAERLAAEVASVPSYTIGLPNLNFKIGSDAYRTGDTIALTIAGGTVNSATGSFVCADSTGQTGVTGTMQFSYTSVSGNVVTYTVANRNASSVAYASAATALTCSMASSGVLITGSSLTAGTTTTVNYEPRGSGIAYDALTTTLANGATGAGPVAVLNTFNQFSLPTSSTRDLANLLDAGTNAASNRTISTSLTNFGTLTAGSTASFTWSIRNEAVDGQLNVSANSSYLGITTSAVTTTTLTGDFNFLDDNANGCTAADLTSGAGRATAASGTLTINSTCTVLTLVSSAGAARGNGQTVTFYVGGLTDDGVSGQASTVGSQSGRTIAPATVSGSVVVGNGSGTGLTATYATLPFTAGTWSATAGASQTANVPYLPYGTGISRVVYFTNKTAVAGTVTISAKGDTGTVCSSTNFAAVSVPANGVTLLTGAIDAGIAACFGATYAGKAQVDITVAGTSGGVVTSAYNVSGNRVNVLNSTN